MAFYYSVVSGKKSGLGGQLFLLISLQDSKLVSFLDSESVSFLGWRNKEVGMEYRLVDALSELDIGTICFKADNDFLEMLE